MSPFLSMARRLILGDRPGKTVPGTNLLLDDETVVQMPGNFMFLAGVMLEASVSNTNLK